MKYSMILVALAAIAALGCKKTYTGEELAGRVLEDSEAIPYYFQAKLELESEPEPIWYDYAVATGQSENNAENTYFIYNDSTYAEMYSAWGTGYFAYSPYFNSWYDFHMEKYMVKYGYLYSHVMSRGITFCFFHPQGNAKWDEATVEAFFQEGEELQFGFTPGKVEVGFRKNLDLLGYSDDTPVYNGILSTPSSNENGYFRIEKVVDAVGGLSPYSNTSDNIPGKQVTISFRSTLLKQYTEEYHGIIEGEATIFIPIEE